MYFFISGKAQQKSGVWIFKIRFINFYPGNCSLCEFVGRLRAIVLSNDDEKIQKTCLLNYQRQNIVLSNFGI